MSEDSKEVAKIVALYASAVGFIVLVMPWLLKLCFVYWDWVYKK